MPGRTLALVTTACLIVMAVAVIGCAAIGLTTTQGDDSRSEAARHAALGVALNELHPALNGGDHFDAGELASIGSRAGLADLRFDTDLTANSGREVQTMQDAQGRIVGWFSWAPDRSVVRAMDQLWTMVAIVGVILAFCAILALRATRRLASALGRSTALANKLTTQDLATGLPNRRVTLARLDDRLAARHAGFVVLALIDIDHTREFSDTLGQAGSAMLLANIAERLNSGLPAGAFLGRFADDEFAAVAASLDLQAASELGDKISAALAEPFVMDQPWHISASIGIAQAPEDGTTGDELYRRASLALRAAKRGGPGSIRRFVPLIHEEHAERRFFRRELEAAIENKTLDVHYQPVVAAEGGAMIGVEALLRWNHPTRGAISPALFIPLAEESGLMNRLGELVLRRALADGTRWPGLFLSVNLSPVQMRSPALVDLVAKILAETGMAAQRLVLEVTEGILIDNPDETLTKIEALRELGVATALDDFGSGYSSLNYLQKFPFDRLKIDRAFVASLGTTAHTGAIIQAIVTLGHALGMKVLAEGVETNEQRVLLRLAGCDEMQGFLFAKACPAEAIDKILARPRPARGAGRRADGSAS
jgi:diguanylate cyclase (GGDEF)-like protein